MLSGLLTRVEGEGQVVLKSSEGRIVGAEVRISEAPRFFEYIVRGRRYLEVPDLVSRICGLCGVSYVLTASMAFERCLSIEVPEDEERLRMAILGAERVKSHMIHVAYLHLPDFLGLSSLRELSESYSHIYAKATKVVLWSRKVMEVLGGRFHNVVNIRVGGVYGFPERSKVGRLKEEFPEVLNSFLDVARFVASLGSIPREVHRVRYMAVGGGRGYPWVGSSVVSDDGTTVGVEDFENFVLTEQVGYSNALRYRLVTGEPYLVGPLARYNLHSGLLRREVAEFLREYGYSGALRNVYQGVIARIAETYQTLLELEEFLEGYEERSVAQVEPRGTARTTCVAATEAPRGILYHRYSLSGDLRVRSCNIITPTAQNLASMEDLITTRLLGSSADSRALEVARSIVRSYDPCISCSVHLVTAV
mgnify:CR=1 FL=1